MGKCKYNKICKNYSDISITCAKTAGEYYGDGRFAGCYRKLEVENGK